MSEQPIEHIAEQLQQWFTQCNKCTIATSGGIDSMVLAFVGSKVLGQNALIAHSSSASVPTMDAQRVAHYAGLYTWNLSVIQAVEMNNSDYCNNPINRCYYCKSSLFATLKELSANAIITGTNTDDLSDFRPGLLAAKEQNILQPYVTLGINKETIRRLAAFYGLDDLKNIPASPCLASRVETGIRIVPNELRLIDLIENQMRTKLQTDVVRFRLRSQVSVLELTEQVFERLSTTKRQIIIDEIQRTLKSKGINKAVELATYQRGNAFVGDKSQEAIYAAAT